MLIGIDRRFTAELLHCLASLGHGDEIAVVDSNFPSHATAAETVFGTVVELPGMSATEAIGLIAQLIAARCLRARMRPAHAAGRQAGRIDRRARRRSSPCIEKVKPADAGLGSIPRQDFYDRAKKAFAVIRTGESRAYGCFILRTGVVF